MGAARVSMDSSMLATPPVHHEGVCAVLFLLRNVHREQTRNTSEVLVGGHLGLSGSQDWAAHGLTFFLNID